MTTTDDARLDAAEALRDLIHVFVAHDHDEAALRDLAVFARRESDAMRQGPRRDRLARMQAARAASGSEAGFPGMQSGSGFEDRAVGGTANPTAIDFDVRYEGDEVVVDAVLHRAFEGAPGRAHGGMVAALFDDVTGFVIARHSEPAFTGQLTVRFLAGVPVEEHLTVRARLDSRERRKLFITADMHAGDTVVAACHAIYITVDPSIFAGAPDPR